MSQNTHLNITLVYRDKNMDLRIPQAITVFQLVKELSAIFSAEMLGKKVQLKVINKGFLLNEKARISDYAIANGDILEVLGDY